MNQATKSAWPQACARCEAPIMSVIDADIGLDDERADIAIVGGGPHALAALAALHEGSLPCQQYGDDGQFQTRTACGSLKKVGTVCVLDPGTHFMQAWNTRFDALEIKHLRSPTFAHPVAFEPTALLNFAVQEGRTSELIAAPIVGSWLVSTDLSEQAELLKALPSSALFRDFCASLEAKLPHRWLSGAATTVCKDAITGKYRVHYQMADGRERKVVARAVVLATGPVGQWNIPSPFAPHLSSRRILHTEALLVETKGTLREEITRRCSRASGRVLVLGGGISAAQSALAAYRAGQQVTIRSRRPLQTRAFDIASEYLDLRHGERLRFEFLSLPMEKRLEALRAAKSGGSVPATYMKELLGLAKESSNLRLEVDEGIDQSEVCVGADDEYVVVNGDKFDMVIMATGVSAAPSSSELYKSIKERFGAPTLDGLPRVNSSLRWVPDEDLFVLGANAVIELGPGGGNLVGAMRGARVLSKALHGLMWNHSDGRRAGPERTVFSNYYASLPLLGNGSESEIDVLARRLNLTMKTESALRKARKQRKPTKGTIILDHVPHMSLVEARSERSTRVPIDIAEHTPYDELA